MIYELCINYYELCIMNYVLESRLHTKAESTHGRHA